MLSVTIVLAFMADVAQLVRALVCGAGGRGFKTHHSPQGKHLSHTDRCFLVIIALRPGSSAG